MKVTDLPKHWESKKESVERSHDYNLCGVVKPPRRVSQGRRD